MRECFCTQIRKQKHELVKVNERKTNQPNKITGALEPATTVLTDYFKLLAQDKYHSSLLEAVEIHGDFSVHNGSNESNMVFLPPQWCFWSKRINEYQYNAAKMAYSSKVQYNNCNACESRTVIRIIASANFFYTYHFLPFLRLFTSTPPAPAPLLAFLHAFSLALSLFKNCPICVFVCVAGRRAILGPAYTRHPTHMHLRLLCSESEWLQIVSFLSKLYQRAFVSYAFVDCGMATSVGVGSLCTYTYE